MKKAQNIVETCREHPACVTQNWHKDVHRQFGCGAWFATLMLAVIFVTIVAATLGFQLALPAVIGGLASLVIAAFVINRWLLCSDEEDK